MTTWSSLRRFWVLTFFFGGDFVGAFQIPRKPSKIIQISHWKCSISSASQKRKGNRLVRKATTDENGYDTSLDDGYHCSLQQNTSLARRLFGRHKNDPVAHLSEDLEVPGVLQELLHTRFPNATKSECYRFLKARKGSLEGSTKQMKTFMQWRELHQLDQDVPIKDDYDVWKYASKKATANNVDGESVELPRVVRTYLRKDGTEACAFDKTRIIQVLPGQIDINIAPAATYALAMAFYVAAKFDRDSLEKATILLDVRAGTGWPNESAYNLLGFVRTVSSLLNQHFPERLQRMLLYPMPTLSIYVWEAAKLFLNQDTTSKIKLLGGTANEDSPSPKLELMQYMDENVLELTENGRKQAFLGESVQETKDCGSLK